MSIPNPRIIKLDFVSQPGLCGIICGSQRDWYPVNVIHPSINEDYVSIELNWIHNGKPIFNDGPFTVDQFRDWDGEDYADIYALREDLYNFTSGIPRVAQVTSLGAKTTAESFPITLPSDIGNIATVNPRCIPYRIKSSAGINKTVISGTANTLVGFSVLNTSIALKYLKIYNLPIDPTPASDTPILTIPIPPLASALGPVNVILPQGINMDSGLSLTITGLVGDTDATSISAGDVYGTIFYYE